MTIRELLEWAYNVNQRFDVMPADWVLRTRNALSESACSCCSGLGKVIYEDPASEAPCPQCSARPTREEHG